VTNDIVPSDRPHVYAFSTKRLVLMASIVLLLIALSLMLGIRIERYQQTQTVAPATPAVMYGSGAKQEPAALKAGVTETPAPAKPDAKSAVSTSVKSQPIAPKKAVAPKLAEQAKPAPKPKKKAAAPKPAPEKEAKTPAPAPKVAPKKHFAVQVQSSQDKAKAALQVDTLKKKGFDAYLEDVQLEGKGTFYRVMVGPFATKAQANEAKTALARDSRFTDSLIRYIP
jgi:cell division septation protein DedD